MAEAAEEATGRRRRRRGGGDAAAAPKRDVDYRHLINSFAPAPAYSDDQIEEIHLAALKVLREIGVKILLPRAIDILRAAGVSVDEDGVARYPADVVEAAIQSSPAEFRLYGADDAASPMMGGRSIVFCSVGGAPHINDLDHGKRPGTLESSENIIKLSERFDVIHVQSPNVEAQDVPTNLRHYAMTRAQLLYSRKVPFMYMRGTRRSGLLRDGAALSRAVRRGVFGPGPIAGR